MKKIFVIGMSENIGGIETFFHTYYNLLDKKQLHFDFVSVSGNIAFDEEYKNNGSKIYKICDFRKNPIKYYSIIKDIMQNTQYDIVHVNMLSAANFMPIIAALKAGAPKIIVHSHNSDTPKGFIRKIMHSIGKAVLKNDRLIKVACSEPAGKWMFGENNKFTVLNNIIDSNKFKFNKNARAEIRKRYDIEENDFLIGNIGRLCEQKNQMFLLKLIKNITDKQVKLMLVGDGSYANILRQEIRKNHLENRVIMVPNTPDVYKYYSAFDVFAFPSKFEGSPIAPIEARAAGLKCLLSDSIACNVSFYDAEFLSIKNPQQWIKAIGEVRTNHIQRLRPDSIYDTKSEITKLEHLYSDIRNNLKISIIVPVYNAEKYLEHCLKSLLGQEYNNIEIIVVNDGSTDNTDKIVQKFLTDKRIKYIAQKNQSQNIARGVGVQHANGEYCMFVDADDWLEPNATERIVACLERKPYDIIKFNFVKEPRRCHFFMCQSKNNTEEELSSEEIKKILLGTMLLREMTFSVYKTKILKSSKLFAERINYGEDYITNLAVYPQAKAVLFISDTLYHYRKNKGSTTSPKSLILASRNLDDTILVCNKMLEYLDRWTTRRDKELRLQTMLMTIETFKWAIYGIAGVPNLSREEFSKICKSALSSRPVQLIRKRYTKKELSEIIRKQSFWFRLKHAKVDAAIFENDFDTIWRWARIYRSRI